MPDAHQPVTASTCPGAYQPPSATATDDKGKCATCGGWYRILASGDVGRHKARRTAGRRHRDARDTASMVHRCIDALGRKIADGDEQELAELIAIRTHLDLTTETVVRALHYEQGFSWAMIGELLGVTKQTAEGRFGVAGRARRAPARRRPSQKTA